MVAFIDESCHFSCFTGNVSSKKTPGLLNGFYLQHEIYIRHMLSKMLMVKEQHLFFAGQKHTALDFGDSVLLEVKKPVGLFHASNFGCFNYHLDLHFNRRFNNVGFGGANGSSFLGPRNTIQKFCRLQVVTSSDPAFPGTKNKFNVPLCCCVIQQHPSKSFLQENLKSIIEPKIFKPPGLSDPSPALKSTSFSLSRAGSLGFCFQKKASNNDSPQGQLVTSKSEPW